MKTTLPERGFTLVELMVALTIGLLITLVVTQAYISGLGTQQAQTSLGRAQEASRFAFDLLARELSQAGYKDPAVQVAGPCQDDAQKRLAAANDAVSIDPSASNFSGSTVTVVNKSDVIRARYFGNADGTVLDCLGNAVPANTIAEDTFYVAANADDSNEPALFCYSSNSAASGRVALVPGVESMQLLFGEDTDSDGAINGYVTSAGVGNMNNVRSVMVSLVTRTKEVNAVDRTTEVIINHFGTHYAPSDTAPSGDAGSVFTVTAPTDGRLRQHSVTTIALRNLCPI